MIINFLGKLFLDSLLKVQRVLFLPILAFIVNEELYGQISLIFASISIITVIISYNAPLYMRHIALKYPSMSSVVLNGLIVYMVLSGLVVTLFLLFFHEPYLLEILSISVLYALGNFYTYYLLGSGSFTSYVKAISFFNFLAFTVPLIFLIFNDCSSLGLVLRLHGIFLFFGLIPVIISNKSLLIKEWNARFLNSIAIKLTPLFLHALFGALVANIDRILMKEYFTMAEIGHYSLLYSVFLTSSFAVAILNNQFIPRVYGALSKGMYSTIKKLRISYFIFGVSLIASVFLLFYIFFVQIYWPFTVTINAQAMMTLFVSSIPFLLYSYNLNILLYRERNINIALVSIVGVISNISLLYIFNFSSLLMVALATGISYVLMAILTRYFVSYVK